MSVNMLLGDEDTVDIIAVGTNGPFLTIDGSQMCVLISTSAGLTDVEQAAIWQTLAAKANELAAAYDERDRAAQGAVADPDGDEIARQRADGGPVYDNATGMWT